MSDLHRLNELRAELHKHNYLYHTLGRPVLTDAEYDARYQELLRLEAQHPDSFDPNSPTQRVGAPSAAGFTKVRHARRMLSLDNAFTADDVLNRLGRVHAVLEPKVDGLSLKLIYRNGQMVQAVTRGNGLEGDDVTANARTIPTIPLVLPMELDLEVTGEVYMTYTQFNALNQELEVAGEELLANPRNAASGSLKSKHPEEVARRGLSFVAHGCLTEINGVTTHLDLIGFLERLRFQTTRLLPQTATHAPVTTDLDLDDPGTLGTAIELAAQRRQYLDLPTDGLVFKINNLVLQRELGEGTKSPKWAVAYKFPPERKSTRLTAITLQVGRTGRITPVAEVEPVKLSGTTVRRASLCNQDEINRLNVGVGDGVWLEKSAEIIPKIVGLAREPGSHKAPTFQLPATCPSCGSPLHREAGAADTYCLNGNCEAQVYGRLLHALGKQCLDLDGCGPVMVRLLMSNGVRKLSDVFAVTTLEGMKPSALRKFMVGREHAKKAPLWRKLHALGIENIGAGTAQDIAGLFPTFISLFVDDGHDDQLRAMRDMLGPVAWDSLSKYLQQHAEEVMRLDEQGFRLRDDALAQGPLAGKVFVITGTLLSASRDAMIRLIDSAGGMVKSSVSAKVHYLVMGEDAGETKSRAAQKHGVKVITEEELYSMMGRSMELPVHRNDTDE